MTSIKYYIQEEALSNGAVFTTPREGDAGYDLYASEHITLFNGEQKLIPTGLHLSIPRGVVGMIRDRSSLALQQIYVHAGVIDSSYRGEIKVLLENASNKNLHVEPGHRVAQLLFVPICILPLNSVEKHSLGESIRGEGSFGSTGK